MERLFGYEHAVIASGTEAAQLPGIPCDGKYVIDSNMALSRRDVPALDDDIV